MNNTTVAQKLEALMKLQQIDSKLDEIEKIKGDLPEEVRDLEDSIGQLETRIKRFNDDINNLEKNINDRKEGIKHAEQLIKKYEAQLMDVKNNREYDAITKEIESQKLDIELYNKKIKEDRFQIEHKKSQADELVAQVEDRRKDLEIKQKELESILEENQVEADKLFKDREKRAKQIDERLYLSYSRIRKNSSNGLAVVAVIRNACGGCFNMVPPQRQADIKEKKKLIVCEHCGRILADVVDVIEEPKPAKKISLKKTATKSVAIADLDAE